MISMHKLKSNIIIFATLVSISSLSCQYPYQSLSTEERNILITEEGKWDFAEKLFSEKYGTIGRELIALFIGVITGAAMPASLIEISDRQPNPQKKMLISVGALLSWPIVTLAVQRTINVVGKKIMIGEFNYSDRSLDYVENIEIKVILKRLPEPIVNVIIDYRKNPEDEERLKEALIRINALVTAHKKLFEQAHPSQTPTEDKKNA